MSEVNMDMEQELTKKLYRAEDEAAGWSEEVSTWIFNHPERGDAEFESSAYLAAQAKKLGLKVEMPYKGLPTAFCAELDNGEGPCVAFLAEYDALPGYGENKDQMAHACGHNWIAASTFAAAAALAGIKDCWKGKIRWVGTPAEETTGRKIDLANAGAFDDCDAVFQMHLSNSSCVDCVALAMSDLVFEFFGKASHASSNPAEGINALDACTLSLAGMNALRQHVESDTRIHSIITNGGKAANVVPDYGRMEVYVRTGNKDYLEEVIERVLNCGRGAALMTGCRFSFERSVNSYYDIRRNVTLNERMKEILAGFGITDLIEGDRYHCGSTDIGNVSYVCPMCYVELGMEAVCSEGPHAEEFLRHVDGPEAHRLLHIAGKAMAREALEVLTGRLDVKKG